MSTDQPREALQQPRRADLLRNDGEMTDGQLLKCFISCRDEAAFEALVRRHGPMVLGVCGVAPLRPNRQGINAVSASRSEKQ